MQKKQVFTRPIVLGVGAQKSGTTWFARMLSTRTSIWVSPLKELHYFDKYSEIDRIRKGADSHHYNKLRSIINNRSDFDSKDTRYLVQLLDRSKISSDEEYIQYLRRYSGSSPAVADITPAYASIQESFYQNIISIIPNAIPVFIIRDPVDRVWSMAQHVEVHDHNSQPRTSIDSIINFSKSAYVRSLTNYPKTIRALKSIFSSPIIEFYEELFSSEDRATSFIQRVANSAGVQADTTSSGILEKIYTGPGRPLPSPWRSALREQLDGIYNDLQQIGYKIPSSWTQ